MNHRHRHVSRAAGFSMVELMVAMVLGLILMGGVISVYTTSKSTYSLNNALGQVQEAGRFAFSYLEPPIRMAGFLGCGHVGNITSIVNSSTATYYDGSNVIQGYEYSGTGVGGTLTLGATPTAAPGAASFTAALPTDVASAVNIGGTSNQAIRGSDVLMLHEALPGGISPTFPYTNGSAGLFVPVGDGAKFTIGELVVITDCSGHSDLFQVTNAVNNDASHDRIDHSSGGATPANIPAGKLDVNLQGSRILFYQTFIFYIGIGKDGGPSLFENSLTASGGTSAMGTPQEMVSGVENMQILYGVDTDGDQIPNAFLTADKVTNWSQVVSMRIALITHSDDNSTDTAPPSAASYVLLGDSPTDTTNGLKVKVSKDRRLRRVFTETISLRNRTP